MKLRRQLLKDSVVLAILLQFLAIMALKLPKRHKYSIKVPKKVVQDYNPSLLK